jgi:3-hydroxyisobutyrate dehydrogenase-like beta-hydroxyacid dehydrogenase
MTDAKPGALGFIGLGVMGEPMCANLVRKSGLPVHGFDLKTAPVERLATLGLKPCGSIAEMAAEAEIVFLSLPSGKEVEAVCLGPDGLLANPGKLRTVVDMSTTPVKLTRDIAKRFAEERQIDFVDAPVARMRQAAKDGTLSIMVGGSPAAFERIRPYLACMGTELTHCGEVGNGQVVKIMNNMVVFMTAHALAEALAIGRSAGVDGRLLFETMSKGSSDSFWLRNSGMKNLLPGHFPEDAFPTDYAIKDISYALELAREGGIDARAAALTHQVLGEASEAGYGKSYYPVILKLIEQKKGGTR